MFWKKAFSAAPIRKKEYLSKLWLNINVRIPISPINRRFLCHFNRCGSQKSTVFWLIFFRLFLITPVLWAHGGNLSIYQIKKWDQSGDSDHQVISESGHLGCHRKRKKINEIFLKNRYEKSSFSRKVCF